MFALEISNLHKTYNNGLQALKGIDLTVEEGDFFALLGPNGAGKSTCIGIITSSTGAAIHDTLSVIARRFPSIPVKLYPVPVQGEQAAPAICRALVSPNPSNLPLSG